MARKALIVKTARRQKKLQEELAQGKKPVMATRVYNRCTLCGRGRGYIGYFKICRICFRTHARQGDITGLKKASW